MGREHPKWRQTVCFFLKISKFLCHTVTIFSVASLNQKNVRLWFSIKKEFWVVDLYDMALPKPVIVIVH